MKIHGRSIRILRASTAQFGIIASLALTAPALAETSADEAAATAPSAEDSSTIGDIVVTARRKAEALQETPVAISALSGLALEQKGVAKASDLMASVPGVFVAPGSNRGSNSPVFAIRGQLNRDPTPTNDPSVGFYFAEAPWARTQGSNAAFVDLESVQVVKGPQGTLFGRNSTAGAILITPKAPTDVFEGYFKATAGDYGLIGAEGVMNIPLGDTLAIRLVGSREKRDGYLTAQTGQVLNDVNNSSLRGSIKWTPSDAFTSTIIAGYFHSSTNGDGSRIFGVPPAAPNAALASFRPRFQDAIARTAAMGKYRFLTTFSPSVTNALLPAHAARVETWNIQNISTLELGNLGFLGEVTLKNIIALRNEADYSTFDTVAVDFLASASDDDQEIRQFSEEFQIQGKSGNLDYIAGLFYFREFGHDTSRNFAVSPTLGVVDNRVANTSYSAFAHATYNVTPALALSAGIRFNNDRRYWNGKNRRGTTPGANPPLFTCNYVPTAPANDGSLCVYPNKITFREPTWDANISYKISDQNLVYVTVAHGYRSGGYSQSAASVAVAAPFKPEKVLNYEIGTKNDFNVGGMNIRMNLSAFYTDYTNIQRTLNFIAPTGNVFNVTTNASKASIFGTEADLTVRPVPALELTLSHSYLKPKYKSFTDIYTERNPAYLPVGATSQNYPIDVSDSQFILISKHSLNASAAYTLPTGDSIGPITLRASYYYRTSFYTTSDINTAHCTVPGDPNPAAIYVNCYNHGGKLPGYGLVNARIDWNKILGTSLSASVFVNNLTNKYYYSNALNALGSFGSISGQVGAPRMFGASLTLPFGN